MTPFLFDVWSQLRPQLRRVAFHEILSIFIIFISSAPVRVPALFTAALLRTMSGLVTPVPRKGPSEWKAVRRFAPLTVLPHDGPVFAYFNCVHWDIQACFNLLMQAFYIIEIMVCKIQWPAAYNLGLFNNSIFNVGDGKITMIYICLCWYNTVFFVVYCYS